MERAELPFALFVPDSSAPKTEHLVILLDALDCTDGIPALVFELFTPEVNPSKIEFAKSPMVPKALEAVDIAEVAAGASAVPSCVANCNPFGEPLSEPSEIQAAFPKLESGI